jgi:hypothetical protein
MPMRAMPTFPPHARVGPTQIDASSQPTSIYFEKDLVGENPPIKRLRKEPATLGLIRKFWP